MSSSDSRPDGAPDKDQTFEQRLAAERRRDETLLELLLQSNVLPAATTTCLAAVREQTEGIKSPAAVAEVVRSWMGARPYWQVNGDTAAPPAQKPAAAPKVVPDPKLEDIFGPTSDTKRANELANSNPMKYHDLREKAIRAGLFDAKRSK